jgi:preprotein translocase subunit YajC
MLLFLATTSKSSSSSLLLLLYIAAFGLIWYFFLRPRSQKRKAQMAEARRVTVGDQCQTIGGVLGTVIAQSDTTVTLRTTTGVELEFVSSAIGRKIEPVIPEVNPDEAELPQAQISDEPTSEGEGGGAR